MLLRAPITGTVVDASGKSAERLMANGFAPLEQPKAGKPAPKAKKTKKQAKE